MKNLILPLLLALATLLLAVGCDDSTKTTAPITCGDGVLDEAEECDGIRFRDPVYCYRLGYHSSTPACADDCTVMEDSCEGPRCGDDLINGTMEECDGTAVIHAGCEAFGLLSGGALTCNEDCRLDVSACQFPEEACEISEFEPVDYETFVSSYARLWCTRVFECCPDGYFDPWIEWGYETYEDCLERSMSCHPVFDPQTMNYNGVYAASCLASIETSLASTSCMSSTHEGNDTCHCRFLLIGKKARGEPCTTNIECANLECTGVEERRCGDYAVFGESCADMDCASNLRCVQDICVVPNDPFETCVSDDNCISMECDGGECARSDFPPFQDTCL